jgi:hypothetical protein
MWVLGHKGIDGNETAHQLAKVGFLLPFIGSEPACGISERAAKQAIRNWVGRGHHKCWQSSLGWRHAKGFVDRPSAKRSTELKLSRFKIRQVTGLLTGHCHLRGHLFNMRNVNNSICRRCYQETETAMHICDYKVLDEL